jgi:hypothetical protein
MIVRILTLAVSLVAAISVANACTEGKDQDGIVPKNNLKVSTAFFKPGQTMTQETFNKIIDGIAVIYAPIVRETRKVELKIVKAWDDATVNAYASRVSGAYQVNMFGGLARHPATTEDGLALVVCHEIGHHIGGFPKKTEMWGSSWASNEGQSDYFATTKCLRKYFEKTQNSAQVLTRMAVPVPVQDKCFASFGQSRDHAICVRVALAGQSMGNLFAALRKLPAKPDFATPDPKVVSATNHNHPDPQCRLDTYFSGALCTVSHTVDLSDKDEKTGSCTDYSKGGARAKCWFKPNAAGFQANGRIASNGQTRNSGNGGFQGGRSN